MAVIHPPSITYAFTIHNWVGVHVLMRFRVILSVRLTWVSWQ